MPGVRLFRLHSVTGDACQVYEPAFAVVAQGAKVVEAGSDKRDEMILEMYINWLWSTVLELSPLLVPGSSIVVNSFFQPRSERSPDLIALSADAILNCLRVHCP